MTRIKICGLFREEDVRYVNEAKPDYAGFVIDFPKSYRSIGVEKAAALRRRLDRGIKAVGVFVNEDLERLADIVNRQVIDVIQLHGDEDDEYIKALRRKTDKKIIKAFLINKNTDLGEIEGSKADMVLLDGGRGDGKQFDYQLIEKIKRPYFLAGGINLDNMDEVLRRLKPAGIDLSSGVERDKVKDYVKIQFATMKVRKEKVEENE